MTERPAWPMMIMRTPKGWTGPKFVDGKPVENTWRAHQVPLERAAREAGAPAQLEEWMRSYKPEELFDEKGALRADLAEIAPKGRLRMGMNAHANGGLLLKPLKVPNFRDFAVKIEVRGREDVESTRVLGELLHAVMQANKSREELPRLRAGRNRVKPHRRRDYRNRQGMDGARRCRWTRSFRRRAA